MSSYSFSWNGENPHCFTEITCPNCHSVLNIHLPDPMLPDRLLGTCGECKSWYVMDCESSTMYAAALNQPGRDGNVHHGRSRPSRRPR
jgi:hypothetical protein